MLPVPIYNTGGPQSYFTKNNVPTYTAILTIITVVTGSSGICFQNSMLSPNEGYKLLSGMNIQEHVFLYICDSKVS